MPATHGAVCSFIPSAATGTLGTLGTPGAELRDRFFGAPLADNAFFLTSYVVFFFILEIYAYFHSSIHVIIHRNNAYCICVNAVSKLKF